jgi:hypothetical protein
MHLFHMQPQLTVIGLIVTVLENLQRQLAAILEQVRGLVLYLLYTLLIFQVQTKQDIFGMAVVGYDLPAQEQAAQSQHKILLGVVFFLLPVHKNLAVVVFMDGVLAILVCILYFQVPHMHLTPIISQPVPM